MRCLALVSVAVGLSLPQVTTPQEEWRTVSLKGLLLDQGFAAGVGNWIADEVLYQAKLDPRRPASSLDDREVGRLRSRLRSVIQRAVEVDAEYGTDRPTYRYPESMLMGAS